MTLTSKLTSTVPTGSCVAAQVALRMTATHRINRAGRDFGLGAYLPRKNCIAASHVDAGVRVLLPSSSAEPQVDTRMDTLIHY